MNSEHRRAQQRLSPRARRLLGRETRGPHPDTRDDVIACLQASALPVYEVVVNFELNWGGVHYVVRDQIEGASFALVPGWEQPGHCFKGAPQPIFAHREQHRLLFACGGLENAPWGFDIDEDGTLYTSPGDSPSIAIASSVHKYVESDAVLDGLLDFSSQWFVVGFPRIKRGESHLDAVLKIPVIEEASDSFTRWWGANHIWVVRGVSQNPEDKGGVEYVRAYVGSERDVQRAIDMVRPNLPIGGNPRISIDTWPKWSFARTR